MSGDKGLDRLTSVDELLAETNQLLRQLAADPGQRSGGESAHNADPTFPFEFSRVVTAGTRQADPATETFTAPSDGTVRAVIVGWPPGTQQAVGFGLKLKSGEALIPRGPSEASFVGYEDQTIEYEINKSMAEGEKADLRFINNDRADHFLNVNILFQEVSGDAR